MVEQQVGRPVGDKIEWLGCNDLHIRFIPPIIGPQSYVQKAGLGNIVVSLFAAVHKSTYQRQQHFAKSGAIVSMQRLRRPETDKWPYAACSTGAYKGLLKQKIPCWEATGPARDLFTTKIAHRIKYFLHCSLPESNSFMTFTLFMVGKVCQKTKPTIMVVPDDKPRRKETFERIKDSKLLADYPGYELGHCKVDAEYEDLRQLGTGDNINPPIHPNDEDQQFQPVRACAGALFCKTKGEF